MHKNYFEDFYIPTYVINLKNRPERLVHIKKQFKEKKEFNLKFIEAVKHDCGNMGLWMSIKKVIVDAIKCDDDIIIICEDDHCFTNN